MNTIKNSKYFLPAVLLFAAQTLVWGQTVTITYDIPNTPATPYSATIPQCVTNVTGEAWGAGGAGGRSNSGGETRGGGGGGAYAKSTSTLLTGQTLTLIVGAGGNGNGGGAHDGGASSVAQGATTFVLAAGGDGVPGGSSTGGAAGGQAGNSIGDVAYSGGSGGNAGRGSVGVGTSGGGGGGAGSTGTGNNGTAGGTSNNSGGGGGTATPNFGGAGGNGAQGGDEEGESGNDYGGGGGGSKELWPTGNAQNGGNGARGLAIITFDFILPVITGNNSYCAGSPLTLNIDAGTICASADYTWKLDGNTVQTGPNTSYTVPSVSSAHAGNYTVEATVPGTYSYPGGSLTPGSGITYSGGVFTLTSSSAFNVAVHTPPTISFTSGTQNPTVCQGTAITNTVYTFGGGATGVSVSNLPAGLTSGISGNTVTIYGTPSASGTYTVSTTGQSPSCPPATINGTVTVNVPPTLSLFSGTQSPTVCQAAPITDIVYTFGGGATGVLVENLPAGLYSATSGNTVTIYGAPTASGTYTVSTTGNFAPCTPVSINGTVTLNYPPTVGGISLTDAIYCANDPLIFPSGPSVTSILPVTDQGWLLGSDIISDPYTLIAADNGEKLKYFVTNACGTTYSNEITITVVVTEITSITPASGPVSGGIYTDNPLSPIDPSGVVTIIGNGFAPFGSPAVTQVSFGGVVAANVTVLANDTLTCTPPARASSGYVTVSITAVCGTTIFTDGYHYDAMNMSHATPDYAPVTGGDTIILRGTGLLAAGSAAGDVWLTLCGVPAEVVSAHNDSIVCITGPSAFSKRDSITIYNGAESRGFAGSFTYYPVTFIANGAWSDAYKWETQTDDRILPYPGAVIHIKANCLQDMDLIDGYPYPNGKMDSITVYPNKSYTIGNGITLDANVFTLKDNASFLNNGNMQATQQNVEHLLSEGRNWYVASPGGTLTANSDRIEWYDETVHSWKPAGSLITGRGYTIFSATGDIAVKFSGTYHDGNQLSPALTRQSDAHIKRGFNLAGNPFPSYWRWTEAAAAGANLYSTIWYRTKAAGIYEFWSYNASGDVAVAPGWSDATPTGSYSLAYIPPMQAFWVRLREGESTGTITFTNSRRSHTNHVTNILKSGGDERPLMRMAISDGKNTDETLLYADSRAQNGFDDYDSDKWFTGAGVELFTLPVGENRELVINGLQEIRDGMEIPLGFLADEGGSFDFFAKEIRNLDRFDVFLRDKWRNREVNLRSGIYNFTSGSAYDTERFSVVFRNLATQTDGIYPAGDGYLFAYSDSGGNLVAIYSGNEDCEVRIYDIAGRLIAVQTIMSNTPTLIKGKFMKGVYVLRAGNYSAKALVK